MTMIFILIFFFHHLRGGSNFKFIFSNYFVCVIFVYLAFSINIIFFVHNSIYDTFYQKKKDLIESDRLKKFTLLIFTIIL